MGCSLSNGRRLRPRPETNLIAPTSTSNILMAPTNVLVQAPVVTDFHLSSGEQNQGNEETQPDDQPLPDVLPTSSGSTMQGDGTKETVVTSIRATDVSLGLGRIPAGFYVVVHHSSLEWRTENKRVSVDSDVVDWDGLIPMPCDPSGTICFTIYASFELHPMVGNGEELRQLTVTLEQVLDRSTKDLVFAFPPKDGDVVSPCSSLMVTVGKRQHHRNELSWSRVLNPHSLTSESLDQLEISTNQGHSALLRYLKHGEKRDLERSIEEFERALDLSPLEHPCRAAAQSNMAMAKFVQCQVNDTDISLDVPLVLYRNALSTRPAGHPDRPSTLIHLAEIHFARLGRRQHRLDATQAEALLDEAKNLSSTDSHENRVAVFMLRLHRGREIIAAGHADADTLTLSMQLLDRFKRFGVQDDLQQAISILEAFVFSTPIWAKEYPAGLTNLGVALLYRFNCLGELGDLEKAILRMRDAADLTPDRHPDKPGRLSNLGNSFRTCFQCIGDPGDIEQAILFQRDAVDRTPDGHPDKPSRLNNLGNSFFARFEHIGQLDDLEQAISRLKNTVDLTPDGHPDKSSRLNNLGNSILTRFEQIGRISDLDQAVSRLKEAVELIPDGHPHKFSRLSNLGNSFLIRFQRIGELDDLDKAISRFKDAIDLIPDCHPGKPGCLNGLGNSLLVRFERIGELEDLEQAISRLRNSVDLTPDCHPDKPSHLNSLGNSFLTRFERVGELGDLEQAISRSKDAVKLTPAGNPNKPIHLNNLGNSFLNRFRHVGLLGDLQQAILGFTDAVNLTPDGHPRKPDYLNNLGGSFLARFQRMGEPNDLEHAISKLKDASHLTPDGHPGKPSRLNSLGSSFLTRFEHIGQFDDLEQAISRLGDAVDLTPDGHPDKPAWLSNLGNSFWTRFQRTGEFGDLEKAISRTKDAVNFTPDGHPDKPIYLNNLGNFFLTRFHRIGELGDLEQALSRSKDAVNLTPDEHPDKPAYLNNLGNSLRTRFGRTGELDDLEHAISRFRDTVNLTPDDHLDKPGRLNNLGNILRTRFEHIGELSDLERSISRLINAVDLTQDGSPHKPARLHNLGYSLFIRFERFGELGDLDQAISRFRNAVDLTPDGHPHKPSHLNSLGNSLKARFQQIGDLGDLEQLMTRSKDAIDLTPDGHSDKPVYLNSLGDTFLIRFQRIGEFSDLEQAILKMKNAVELTPNDHHLKARFLNNLGNSFKARFERLREPDDLDQAISMYSRATCTSGTGISTTTQFVAAHNWLFCAREFGHPSLLHSYSSVIDILPRIAWIGSPLAHRCRELLQGADIAREAAAAALGSGQQETAVEWLEQGRSIIWGGVFQLRSSYEELSLIHPERADRLRQLSVALENASAAREKSLSLLFYDAHSTGHTAEPLEQEADRHRTLAIARDKLLREIRELPGFERFLLHKEFSQLRASAHFGPVVILNAADSRCDALIVLANVEDVIHVPLPNFTLNRSEALQTSLKSMLHREGKRLRLDHTNKWKSLLSTLWKSIVKPVLDALGFSAPGAGNLSRIFWCPTGPFTFLPIHAAGLYDEQYSQPGHKLSDFVVSSYIPTLSILAPSPELDATSSNDFRFLAVRQPLSDGLSPLPGVDEEMYYIKAIFQDSPSAQITLLESSVGTVEEVLELMKEADWVHFACHGIQDDDEPTGSGLCLADGRRLKVSDIISLSRPRGGLAFLSACETAMGDKGLSDEAIHIAAGMLFAGYGSVVATMWSISDRIAPRVAKDVYEQLFRNATRPDPREAARALQDAVGRIRDGGASFEEWLPFIHVGL